MLRWTYGFRYRLETDYVSAIMLVKAIQSAYNAFLYLPHDVNSVLIDTHGFN